SVDDTLPADGGAGCLEVHQHHEQQVLLQARCGGGQTLGVVPGGHGVVDAAWAGHHEQAVVPAGEQVGDPGAGALHQVGGGGGKRELAGDLRRGGQGVHPLDAEVLGGGLAGNGGHGRSVLSGGPAA